MLNGRARCRRTGFPAWTISSFTEYATRKTFATIQASSQYHDFTLTSYTPIAKGTGFTKLAWLAAHDIDNSNPGGGDTGAGFRFYAANQSGTSNDPKLVVTYSSAAAGGSPVFFNWSMLLDSLLPFANAESDTLLMNERARTHH